MSNLLGATLPAGGKPGEKLSASEQREESVSARASLGEVGAILEVLFEATHEELVGR